MIGTLVRSVRRATHYVKCAESIKRDCRRNRRCVLEHESEGILQCELDSPRRGHSVGRLAEAWSFQKAHRDAEVGAVDKVEYLSAENDLLCARYREAFDE